MQQNSRSSHIKLFFGARQGHTHAQVFNFCHVVRCCNCCTQGFSSWGVLCNTCLCQTSETHEHGPVQQVPCCLILCITARSNAKADVLLVDPEQYGMMSFCLTPIVWSLDVHTITVKTKLLGRERLSSQALSLCWKAFRLLVINTTRWCVTLQEHIQWWVACLCHVAPWDWQGACDHVVVDI